MILLGGARSRQIPDADRKQTLKQGEVSATTVEMTVKGIVLSIDNEGISRKKSVELRQMEKLGRQGGLVMNAKETDLLR